MVNGQEGKWNRGPVWMRVISEVGFVYEKEDEDASRDKEKGDEAMRMMGTGVGLVCALYPDELGRVKLRSWRNDRDGTVYGYRPWVNVYKELK